MLTAKNGDFCSMIQREKDKWEICGNISPDEWIEAAIVKYNNLEIQSLWSCGEFKQHRVKSL